jgi:hypothetical protein
MLPMPDEPPIRLMAVIIHWAKSCPNGCLAGKSSPSQAKIKPVSKYLPPCPIRMGAMVDAFESPEIGNQD